MKKCKKDELILCEKPDCVHIFLIGIHHSIIADAMKALPARRESRSIMYPINTSLPLRIELERLHQLCGFIRSECLTLYGTSDAAQPSSQDRRRDNHEPPDLTPNPDTVGSTADVLASRV